MHHFPAPFIAAMFLAAAFISQAAPKRLHPNSETGASLAVVAEPVPLVHTTQFLPFGRDGKIINEGNATKQIEQTLANLEQALRAADSGLDQIVKINVCAANAGVVRVVEKTFAKTFIEFPPAVSFVVGGLSHEDALVAMDAVAQCKPDTSLKEAAVRRSGNGQTFAQTRRLLSGGAIYISGQAKPGELAEATTKNLESLEETLKFLGVGKSDVVQIKCFIEPAAHAEIAKSQIAKFYAGETVPPIVFVDWTSPKLPIEIEMVVAAPENRAAKESVSFVTPPEFKPSPVYSKVARVNYGKLIYVSGLYGTTAHDSEKQILEIFGALKKITDETGTDFDSLAKATYYVSDAIAGGKLNSLRLKFYNPKRPPAASKALVKGVGRDGMSVTIDMIAVSEK